IKLVAPQLAVTLIESQPKKVAFLRELARALHLEKTTVFPHRAEKLKLKAQIVTMRAVEKFESALQVAAGLVESGGKLALLIGALQADSAYRQLPYFACQDPIAIPESRARVLLIGKNR